MTEREKFEAWVKNPHMLDKSTSPDDCGQYTHPWTIGAWKGWQAAIANQWQPIETAPKDGTEIILCGDGRVTSGQWVPERWPTASEYHGVTGEYLGQFETGQCLEAYWSSQDGGFTEQHPPNRWLPLPPPLKE